MKNWINTRLNFKKQLGKVSSLEWMLAVTQAAANNLSYTKERADKYLYSLPIAKNPLVLVSRKDKALTSLQDIAGKTTQDDTGTSTAKGCYRLESKSLRQSCHHPYSGEDVAKRLTDLANGEFDFLIFDKISVQKIIQDRVLDLNVVDLESNDNPNNYIIFSSDQKNLKTNLTRFLKNSTKMEPLKNSAILI